MGIYPNPIPKTQHCIWYPKIVCIDYGYWQWRSYGRANWRKCPGSFLIICPFFCFIRKFSFNFSVKKHTTFLGFKKFARLNLDPKLRHWVLGMGIIPKPISNTQDTIFWVSYLYPYSYTKLIPTFLCIGYGYKPKPNTQTQIFLSMNVWS